MKMLCLLFIRKLGYTKNTYLGCLLSNILCMIYTNHFFYSIQFSILDVSRFQLMVIYKWQILRYKACKKPKRNLHYDQYFQQELQRKHWKSRQWIAKSCIFNFIVATGLIKYFTRYAI